MPPNINQTWDSTIVASKRFYRDHHYRRDFDDEDDSELFVSDDDNLFTSSLKPTTTTTKIDDDNNDNDGRKLWKQIIRKKIGVAIDNDEGEENKEDLAIKSALSSIIALDNETENEEWLNRFQGRLSNVSSELLQGLRKHAPNVDDMSTVADFNDNLLYHMKREHGLDNFICDGDDEYGHLRSSHVQELEETLQADEYIGSFLTTKSTTPQPPHVDYTWEILEQYGEENPTQSLMLGFFPLTEEGMFLQIWPTASTNLSIDGNFIEGEIVFIPYKKILIVPATTIHGGGFRTTTFVEEPGRCGNLRFHLYIAASATTGTGATLPAHQTNKYTEPHDKTKELSRRYVDSKHMQVLLQNLFV